MTTAHAVVDTERIDNQDAIAEVLTLYMDGAAQGDAAKLREAFHEDARVFGGLGEQRYDIPIAEFIDIAVGAPADTGAYRGRVVSVNQIGEGALAVVAEDGYWGTMSFVALFSLARIDGRWLIVNKTFTHTGGEPPA